MTDLFEPFKVQSTVPSEAAVSVFTHPCSTMRSVAQPITPQQDNEAKGGGKSTSDEVMRIRVKKPI